MNTQLKAKCIKSIPYSKAWYKQQQIGRFLLSLDHRQDASEILSQKLKPSPTEFQDLLF